MMSTASATPTAMGTTLDTVDWMQERAEERGESGISSTPADSFKVLAHTQAQVKGPQETSVHSPLPKVLSLRNSKACTCHSRIATLELTVPLAVELRTMLVARRQR